MTPFDTISRSTVAVLFTSQISHVSVASVVRLFSVSDVRICFYGMSTKYNMSLEAAQFLIDGDKYECFDVWQPSGHFGPLRSATSPYLNLS